MNIRDFDLNLLHVFSAVYTARSVSRAAQTLGLSQPAVSHALTRLRLALRDPLFTRCSGGVAPTSRADQFARSVDAALRQLDVALSETQRFDAAHSQRRFVVHMSDIGADEFLPPLMAAIGREAPGVRLEAVQMAAEAVAPALEDRRLDLAIGYLTTLAGTESLSILQERYVVLLRAGHPLAARLRDRSVLERLEFVLVDSHTEPARVLHLLGLQARIRLTLPHFMVAPAILAATDLAVILPRRPALRFAATHGLQVVEVDLGLPPFTVAMYWTWRAAQDAGHRWLRAHVAAMRLFALPEAGQTQAPPPQQPPPPPRPRRPRAASASAAATARTRRQSAR